MGNIFSPMTCFLTCKKRSNGCKQGATVAWCSFDGGHWWPESYSPLVWSFLREHVKRNVGGEEQQHT